MASVSFTGRGNSRPLAGGGSGSAIEDQALASMVSLQGSDADAADALTLEIVSQPAHGILTNLPGPGQSIFSAGTHSISYQPNPNFSGTDSFTYRIYDGLEYSTVATATIDVLPVNDPPVAVNQTVTTPEDTPIIFALNATDVDGDALTVTLLTNHFGPTVTVDGVNVTVTPEENVSGSLTYNYEVSDGHTTSTAAFTIVVTPVNRCSRHGVRCLLRQ